MRESREKLCDELITQARTRLQSSTVTSENQLESILARVSRFVPPQPASVLLPDCPVLPQRVSSERDAPRPGAARTRERPAANTLSYFLKYSHFGFSRESVTFQNNMPAHISNLPPALPCSSSSILSVPVTLRGCTGRIVAVLACNYNRFSFIMGQNIFSLIELQKITRQEE